jgi:phospholipase/carboxylesterase
MKRRPSSPSRSERDAPGRASLALGAAFVLACQSSPGVHPGGGASNPTAQAAAPSVVPPTDSAALGTPKIKAAPGAAAPNLAFVEVVVGGASAEDPLPLVVALHGLGDRPENFVGVFEGFPVKARVVAPHSATAMGDGFAWFAPFGAMSDEAAPAMASAADDIATFATRMAALRPTLGKPLVVGFSQGGALSYAVAVRHPDAIAASFPIGGWLPPPLWPANAPHDAAPIHAFHGTADNRVPIERDRAGADKLRELGFPMELMEVEGVAHAIPPSVRAPLFAALAAACDHQRGRR